MKIAQNIFAILIGIFIGSLVNMGLIQVSGSIIAPPNGIDLTTEEGLKAGMHLMEVKHFIFPFLAHALGTLFGAIIAGILAVNNRLLYAMIVSVFFFIGGIAAVFMIPAPLWFCVVDLVFAYFPMGFLAGKMAMKLRK